MSLAAALLAPLMLVTIPTEPRPEGAVSQVLVEVPPALPANRLNGPLVRIRYSFDPAQASAWQFVVQSIQPQVQHQVRIEQHITIRITPRPAPAQPSTLADLPHGEVSSQMVERNMGNCLPISGIAGVQAARDNRLILYMRDRRMVSAALERSCAARDFYSGFYLARSVDGQLCVHRDTLLSRSGANCKLTQLRQLVDRGN
jgi:hypothetical protein